MSFYSSNCKTIPPCLLRGVIFLPRQWHDLYKKKKTAKTQLAKIVTKDCESHLNHLSIQRKFLDSARLDTSSRTWNKLRVLSGFQPGQLSLLLKASLDTLFTAVNVFHWHIQSSAKCTLCDSTQPTIQLIFWVVARWHYLSRGTLAYCHNFKSCIFWSPMQVNGIFCWP